MKVSPLSVMVLLALSHSAFSASIEEVTNNATEAQPVGFWVGAGLGAGQLDDSIPGNMMKESSSAFSGKINGGYDFNEYFGMYGSYDFYQNRLMANYIHIGSMGVLGKIALSDDINFLGKAGGALVSNGDNSNGFAGTIGLGLEYQLTHRISAVAGMDYYNDIEFSRHHTGDLYQAYWGLNYRFNQPDTPLVVTKEIEVIKEVPVEVIKEVEVEKKSPIILSSSTGEKLFANNSSILTSKKSLEKLLEVLKEAPASHATIVGYTDSRGQAQYNQWLSERRAKSVADYFIQHGINKSRITYSGMGEQNSIANNTTAEGRAQNRRVEISID